MSWTIFLKDTWYISADSDWGWDNDDLFNVGGGDGWFGGDSWFGGDGWFGGDLFGGWW